MTSDAETFRKGASAYRNARNWAKEQRDEFIRLANARRLENQIQNPSMSQQPFASDAAVALDDSDASTVSGEVEYHHHHYAQWSFAAEEVGGRGV